MIRRWVARLAAWLNARLGLVATDAESAMYDRLDRELRKHGQ